MMANRTDDQSVCDVLPANEISTFAPFIKIANLQVTKIAAGCASHLDAATLAEIETWLAAHYAAVANPVLAKQEEKFEQYSVKLSRGNTNMTGVMSTQYGQVANELSCGCLQKLSKRPISLTANGGAIYDE